MKKPLALIIMDGFGCRPENYGNAIDAAKHPNIDRLIGLIERGETLRVKQVFAV